MSKCELHIGESKLSESHIIPKFIYNWMKKTGPGRFRQMGKFNTPIQDGIKKNMLCKDCEDKFSKYEKWFNENVFQPYLLDNKFIVKNQKELEYFAVSVLWRVLKFFKDSGINYNFRNELDLAELEWRNYLHENKPLNKFSNIHFILIDSDYWIEPKSDLYFSRAVDMDIAESENVSLIYAKYSRFIFIGEISGFTSECFTNTNIALEDKFSSANQNINRRDIFDFFNTRIENIKLYDDLSEGQKEKNDKFYKGKMDKSTDNDYLRILKKYK